MCHVIGVHRVVLLQLLLLATLAERVAAQRGAVLVLGTRVRAHHTDPCCINPLPGALVSLSADSLVVRADGGSGERVALPRAALRSLERRHEVGSRANKGARLGLLAGVATGAATALLAVDCERDEICGSMRPLLVLIGTGIGGLAGAVIGIVIGGSMPREEWRGVPLPTRVGIAPLGPTTRGIALRLRF